MDEFHHFEQLPDDIQCQILHIYDKYRISKRLYKLNEYFRYTNDIYDNEIRQSIKNGESVYLFLESNKLHIGNIKHQYIHYHLLNGEINQFRDVINIEVRTEPDLIEIYRWSKIIFRGVGGNQLLYKEQLLLPLTRVLLTRENITNIVNRRGDNTREKHIRVVTENYINRDRIAITDEIHKMWLKISK